jgi:PqqD family protein of HPr-rel-A system
VNTDPEWHVVGAFELLWRSWGDEVIVYHTGSGDTHLLSPAAAEVLRTLQRTPTNAKELTAQVAASLKTPPDEEFELHIEDVLATLNRLGIIERVHS